MGIGTYNKSKVQFGLVLNGKTQSKCPFKDSLNAELKKAYSFKTKFNILIAVPIISAISLIILLIVLGHSSGSIPTWNDIGFVYAMAIIVNVVSTILLVQQVSSYYFAFKKLGEDEAEELVDGLATAQYDWGLGTLLFKRHLIVYVGSPAGSGLHIIRIRDILFLHKQKEYKLGKAAIPEVLFDAPKREAIIIHTISGQRICFAYGSGKNMRERQDALAIELINRNSNILFGNTSKNRKEYRRICKEQRENQVL